MNNEPRFDKNYLIAAGLVMLILMGYPFLLKKFYPQAAAPTVQEQQAAQSQKINADNSVAQTGQSETSAVLDSVTAAASSASVIPFENEFYHILFSTLGGTITELHYKGEPEKHEVTQTSFLEVPPSSQGLFGTRLLNEPVDLTKEIFRVNKKDGQNLEFVYEKAGEFRLVKNYIFSAETPAITLNIQYDNLSTSEKSVPVELVYGIDYTGTDQSAMHFVEALVSKEKIESKNIGHIAKKGFFASGEIAWAGVVKKYFAILVKPQGKILSQESRAENEVLWSSVRFEPMPVGPQQSATKQVFIYAGPQHYETLKDLGIGLENILFRGFFGIFKIGLLIALKFVYNFTHNYGWAIILLTVALKGAFTPLTHMSYESMKKMQAIQPKLKSLQERYKSDPAKLNKEMMELYKRNRVNPMAGCLPMLAQIPVFIAFYQVLNETIELKGAPFIFWIKDLAEPDKLFALPFTLPFVGGYFNILPLLMIGSMFWQQKLTPQSGMQPEQQKMMAWMPVIFGFFFYNMPSGLVLYWFVNNMLTIIHQVVIKRMVIVLHHEDRE